MGEGATGGGGEPQCLQEPGLSLRLPWATARPLRAEGSGHKEGSLCPDSGIVLSSETRAAPPGHLALGGPRGPSEQGAPSSPCSPQAEQIPTLVSSDSVAVAPGMTKGA